MPVQIKPAEIVQIGIVVRDAEATAARYAALFDLPPPHFFSAQAELRATYRGQMIEAGLKGAVFDMGRIQVELLQPLDAVSAWADFLAERGEGIHHIAFQVSDTDAAVASFTDYGYSIVQQGLFASKNGRYTYLDTDKDMGIVVELMERFDGGHAEPRPFNGSGIGTNVVTQVAVMVHDIEAVKRRVSEVFGLPEPPLIVTSGYERTRTTYFGKPCDATASLAFFDFGQAQLELIEPDPQPSVWRDFLNARGQRGHHIAFQVTDSAGVTAFLNERGLGVAQQGLYGDLTGMYTYMDSEADLAVSVELLEDFAHAPDHD
ncbi:MAG: VOC family protein [Chloroflexi bacterium]|nr:VOC family protein [Chloroflexota bacterium]